jgi:hypothetical protein
MAAPQDVVAQIWNGTAWVDLVTLSGTGCTITRGSDGESGTRPSGFSLDLNNDDGRYRTSDPMSPLYGLAGRNTRARIRVGGTTITEAEAASWRPTRTVEHQPGANKGLAVCSLAAEGVLRRIMNWQTPLQSDLRRTLGQFSTLVGYFPFEDKSKATLVSNVVAGGQPGTRRDGEPAGIEGPPGSGDLLKIDATTSVVGTFKTMSAAAGFQVSFSIKLAAIPASATIYPLMQFWTANGYRWTMAVNSTNYEWTVIDIDGTLVKTFGTTHGVGAEPNQWIIHRIKVTQVGGNVQIEPAWYPETSSVLYGTTSTYVGTISAPTRWRVSGNPHTIDAGFGHLLALRGVAEGLLNADVTAAFIGHAGETAGARYERLLDQAGIGHFMTGVAADTAPMGPQRPLPLMTLLKEIIATEDAVLMDRADALGLHLFTRSVLYNQPVALALAYTDLAPTLEEATDNQGVANVVTVSNSRGGEYTAALESGALSRLAPPAGIGEEKSAYDVNVADETLQLQQTAEWYLGKGTINRARYPKVTVDLLANPGLVAAVNACDISDRITITGLERELVDLLVVGKVEKIGHTTRLVEFTCVPADVQHNVGVYDAVTSRYDSASTTLAAGTTATAVTMLLTTTDRDDCWSTTETPYVAMVAGERVTVTAMTAPAGTGPYTQTATVTRSVVGGGGGAAVVKSHLAGEQFSLADPVYAGL